MRCTVHCPAEARGPLIVAGTLGAVAVGLWVSLHVWLAAAAVGVVAACYLLSVAIALVLARFSVPSVRARPRPRIVLRAQSVRITAGAPGAVAGERPAIRPRVVIPGSVLPGEAAAQQVSRQPAVNRIPGPGVT